MISPFSLLACSVMSSWPWRCRFIRGDLPRVCLLVLASVGCGSLLVLLISPPLSPLACPPRLLVSCGGELGHRGSLLPAVVCLVTEEEGVALRGSLLRSNETAGTMVSVWIVWISFSRLLGSGSMGYILYRALSMVRRLFSLVFSADGFASS